MWMTFAQCWCYHNSIQHQEASIANIKESVILLFANQDKEDSFYPLTTREKVEAQQHDKDLINSAEKESSSTQLVKDISVLCKIGKMVIPKSLQQCTVAWFHHYL